MYNGRRNCLGFQGHGMKGQGHSGGHENRAIARETLRGFEQKLTQMYCGQYRRTDYVFKVMDSKVKVRKTLAGGGLQIDGSPSKTVLFFYAISLQTQYNFGDAITYCPSTTQ